MKEKAFKHKNDRHGAWMKGFITQSVFKNTFTNSGFLVEKTPRSEDLLGVDFVMSKGGYCHKVAVSSFWHQKYNKTHLRVAVRSRNNENISTLFNTKADLWAYYAPHYPELFYIVRTEEFRKCILRLYSLQPIDIMLNLTDNLEKAADRGLIQERYRDETDCYDYFVYPTIESIKRIFNGLKELEVPFEACVGTIYE